MRTDTEERFAGGTSGHEMTVLHDDGLYRHLRFKKPGTGIYWFGLVTVPGSLIFQGDGRSLVFSRIDDMFEFFRSPTGQINPGYWAEKLTSGRDQVMKYDEEIFTSHVLENAAEALHDDPGLTGLTEAVQREIIESDEIGFEAEALRAVRDFEFYKNEEERYRHGKSPDFQFDDVWEWNCRDYDWWFLWACHAIVWGIAQYDGLRLPASRSASVSSMESAR